MTLVALDAHYPESGGAVVGAVLFDAWEDAAARIERAVRIETVAAYEPGAFYRRELPCLLAALDALPERPDVVIVDGYVTLDADGAPGLGARLYEAMGAAATVVGVAKTAFQGAAHAARVLRGGAETPLYVTAAGAPLDVAAARVQAMHGPHRLPTLLKRADALSRRR